MDSAFADCHYNAALLYEGLGEPQKAIRHMGQYRRLTKKKSSRGTLRAAVTACMSSWRVKGPHHNY